MPRVLPARSLQDTTLWKQLQSRLSEDHDQEVIALVGNLPALCDDASDLMKAMPTLHDQYTLHDHIHLLRVTELMARIIPDAVLKALNPIELALLILAAHFHDTGMVASADEIGKLAIDGDFVIFRDNWTIAHPNLREVREHPRRDSTGDSTQQDREIEHQLLDAMLSDYLRQNHGARSRRFVRERYSTDPRLQVAGANLATLLADICASHTLPADSLTYAAGLAYDESIGPWNVNSIYLALVLRLADVLDLDRDRTPDVLYRTIHFTSKVSLQEWEKHRAITGWTITSTAVGFTASCEHPVYERAIRQFMDWVDEELMAASALARSFPAHVASYRLELPLRADRSRIRAKDGAYIYHDLEFSLSRDEIVKLLMTESLYDSPSLCVRELLQNALDALRYRKALVKRDSGTDWCEGRVALHHGLDEHGREVICCTDNGVGMDEDVITRFLTKAGRSYYRSPEFEHERRTLSAAGTDFDPCSQFGIGFMSCFMLGDQITVRTRRDYGPSRGLGKPLVVEINGLGGLLVIRPGQSEQPVGTTVCISGREKPGFFDEWRDRVKLLQVVKGYALATEFPIEAECTVPEIRGALEVPPTPAAPITLLEQFGIKPHVRFEQSFSEVHPLLSGTIAASFLADDVGLPTTANAAAEWQRDTEHAPSLAAGAPGGPKAPVLPHLRDYDGKTCVDGILVCGEPGRDLERLDLGWRANVIDLGEDPFVLDIRGSIKPPLTPARVPAVQFANQCGARWDWIHTLADRAHGRLWEKVAALTAEGLHPSIFWQLATIHRAWVPHMRRRIIISHVRVPTISDDGTTSWRAFAELGRMTMQADGQGFLLRTMDGARVDAPDELAHWQQAARGDTATSHIRLTVLSLCQLVLDEEPLLEVGPFETSEDAAWQVRMSREFGYLCIPFVGDLKIAVSAELPTTLANSNHALVGLALRARYTEPQSRVEEFAQAAVRLMADRDDAAMVDPAAPVSRRMRYIGHLFRAIDWSETPVEIRAPYSIWRGSSGMLEITAADFERWASAPPIAPD